MNCFWKQFHVVLLTCISVANALVFQPLIEDPFDVEKYEMIIYDNAESLDRLMSFVHGAGYQIENRGSIGTYTDCIAATPVSNAALDSNGTDEEDKLSSEKIEVILEQAVNVLNQSFFTSHPSSNFQQGQGLQNKAPSFPPTSDAKFIKYVLSRDGFWTYKFTYSQDIVQYAGETLNYTLGVHNPSLSPQLLSNEDGFYISESYDMGMICEPTNKPRTVEVQYVCDPDIAAAQQSPFRAPGVKLLWVKEWKICQYQAKVAVSGLCKIPLLSKATESHSSTKMFCKDPFRIDSTKDFKKSTKRNTAMSVITSPNYETHFVGNNYYFLSNKDEEETDYIVNSLSVADFTMDLAFSSLLGPLGPAILTSLVKLPSDVVATKRDFQWMCEIFGLNGDYLFTAGVNFGSQSSVEFHQKRIQNTRGIMHGNFIFLSDLKNESFQNGLNDSKSQTNENFASDSASNKETVLQKEEITGANENERLIESNAVSDTNHFDESTAARAEKQETSSSEDSTEEPEKPIPYLGDVESKEENENVIVFEKTQQDQESEAP
ncbi:hypothetical protein ACO0RG_003485 [Hanseniaspora osmophila]